MKEQEPKPNDNDAATFKIKDYELGDWHLRTYGVDEQEFIDEGGVWEQTVLHDVPLTRIFDRETINSLSDLKAKQEKNQ